MTRGVLPNHPWITIQRPAVCILTVFLAFVGALLVTVPRGDAVDLVRLVLALIGAYAVAASTQITNDVADREIDAVEKPDRPIPAGKISVQQAARVGLAGYLIAIVCGWLVSMELGYIYTGIVAISVHYNYHGKGLPLVGNVEVALCVASIPIFGAASQGRPWDLWFLWAFIFTFEVGRELVVTAQDLEGDRSQGLKTLPVYIGQKWSLAMAVVLYGLSSYFIFQHGGTPGFGWIFILGSVFLVFSLVATVLGVVMNEYAFDAFERFIRERGRLCILVWEILLLIEVFV
jgi:geranylgeranylglycerol-phosphate geranylgeranyltransferase